MSDDEERSSSDGSGSSGEETERDLLPLTITKRSRSGYPSNQSISNGQTCSNVCVQSTALIAPKNVRV